jgi:glycerol-3-phosphate O-acyltransferase
LDGKLITEHGPEADAASEESIYSVPEERRMALEYYKNNVLHFFVPSALISAALLAGGPEPVGLKRLRDRVQQLSRLFKYEFMYRADATFDEIFEDTLAEMLAGGELERLADTVRVTDERLEDVTFYASLIRTYFESYRLAVRGAGALLERPLSRKDWVKRTLATGRRMYLAGEIELHESLSKLRLDNAVRSLRDFGVIAYAEGDALTTGDEVRDQETLDALEAQLAVSLP